ncbi:hypothetical protein [Nocardioides sp. L-11A]|uniref:hypothetical protein n=1 Tax=Nocardioides sp. L-11A TaxID=3043848 RepID=UPI00249A1EFC|nr:hypothetical protein QJ852_13195 [Nocardioides sp. L-11A]
MRSVSRALVVGCATLALLLTSAPAPTGAAVGSVAGSAPKGPGGSYAGAETPTEPNPLDRLEIDFEVTENGRKVKNWQVLMNVVCGLDVRTIVQPMATMKVKKNGRFHGVDAGVYNGTEYRVEVSGKLVAKKRKVKAGTLSYKVGWCQRGTGPSGPLDWTAKRTGR